MRSQIKPAESSDGILCLGQKQTFFRWETLSIFSFIMLIVTGGDRKTAKQVECKEAGIECPFKLRTHNEVKVKTVNGNG
jgi:hypothetical protein